MIRAGHLYNFGLSQEDELTEATALGVGGGRGRVLSVASAGDMPLSLAALGAERVTAIDVDPRQLELARLKLVAATVLPREEAARFLGYMEARPGERSGWLARILPALPPSTAAFFTKHRNAALGGAIWAGRFELYVRRVAALVMPVLGRRRYEGLLDCATRAEQEAHFEAACRPAAMRSVFRVIFNPRVYRQRGMDPRALSHREGSESLGDQFYGWFRAFCTATPARTNYFLQLFLFGKVRDLDAVPAYLSAQGVERLRASGEHLRFVQSDILSILRELRPGEVDAVHLSNVSDWIGPEGFDEVMRLLAERLARPARIVWRHLHVAREVPAELAGSLRVDRGLGDELRRRDRFPFYTLWPATLA